MSMEFKNELHKQKFIDKLEDPNRIAELAPSDTLRKIGLKPGDVFCDVGAGTGVFTIPSAVITENTVYAVDTSEDMQKHLISKAVTGMIIEGDIRNIKPCSCDKVLLCSMLHEVENIPDMSRELQRILKDDGILAVIEFYKKDTAMGPPMSHRISEDEVAEALNKNFKVNKSFALGDNFYCLCFEKN